MSFLPRTKINHFLLTRLFFISFAAAIISPFGYSLLPPFNLPLMTRLGYLQLGNIEAVSRRRRSTNRHLQVAILS